MKRNKRAPVVMTLKQNRAAQQKNREDWARAGKLRADQVEIFKAEIGGGKIQYTCMPRGGDSGSIFGLVIIRELNWLIGHAEVLESFVDPVCRRKGVRTLIHHRILQDYGILTTIFGTTEGEAWMRATGYTYDPTWGQWVFRAKKSA